MFLSRRSFVKYSTIGIGLLPLLLSSCWSNESKKQKNDSNNLNLPWGLYSDWALTDLKEVVKELGVYPSYVSLSIPWDNASDFPYQVFEWLRMHEVTPIIFLNPLDSFRSYSDVLNGMYDTYLASFNEILNNEIGKNGVVVVPFEEANGDWYPWSGSLPENTPDLHNEAYRHVRRLFVGEQIKFGLALNHQSFPNTSENGLLNYYPGDEYVDYLGLDGFNWGGDRGWLSFADIFGPALNELSPLNRPVHILSTACAQDTNKTGWIKNLPSQARLYPQIASLTYFNYDDGAAFRLDSNDLEAFKEIVS